MAWEVDPRFDMPVNADIMRFVRAQQPSAHSDVSEELYRAIKGVPGAAIYCPDNAAFAWVAAHTPDCRIFALGYGMRAYALRVGAEAEAEAVADGAILAPEIGRGCIVFDPFRVDVKTTGMRVLLARWTTRAMGFVAAI